MRTARALVSAVLLLLSLAIWMLADVRLVTILHLNDLHARLLPDERGLGGFAHVATAIGAGKRIATSAPVLHFGDMGSVDLPRPPSKGPLCLKLRTASISTRILSATAMGGVRPQPRHPSMQSRRLRHASCPHARTARGQGPAPVPGPVRDLRPAHESPQCPGTAGSQRAGVLLLSLRRGGPELPAADLPERARRHSRRGADALCGRGAEPREHRSGLGRARVRRGRVRRDSHESDTARIRRYDT